MEIKNIKNGQKESFLQNLTKGFLVSDGVYVDNFINRKLGRVGQPYKKDKKEESEELVLEGIKFKKYGEEPYPGRNGRGVKRKGKQVGLYKAKGPTGNVIYTNDFNNDFSVSLPKQYSIYDVTKNTLKPADYIRLKDDKVKDYFNGKISIEEAGTPFSWEYFVKNGSEEEKKLKGFVGKKMDHKHTLSSEESKKMRKLTDSRDLEGLIELLDIKEKDK